jgi:hypothetical protein
MQRWEKDGSWRCQKLDHESRWMTIDLGLLERNYNSLKSEFLQIRLCVYIYVCVVYAIYFYNLGSVCFNIKHFTL